MVADNDKNNNNNIGLTPPTESLPNQQLLNKHVSREQIPKGKPGRLSNAERLAKSRSSSASSIKDYLNKRKRDLEESLIQELNDLFSSHLTVRKKISIASHSSPTGVSDPTTKILPPFEPDISPIKEKSMTESETVTLQTLLREIQKSREEISTQIMEFKSEQATQLQTVNNEIAKLREQNSTKFKSLEEELQKLKTRTEKLESKNRTPSVHPSAEIQDKLNYVVKSLKKLEKEDKRATSKNIIIKGLTSAQDPTQAAKITAKFLMEKFEIENVITNVETLGKNRNICRVTLENTEVKSKIISTKKTALKDTHIYIDNELTNQEQFIARKLRNFARNHPENHARAIGQKIIIYNT
ncbi:hypothetical protein KQX54_010151, partial [Cotesia glomerata]